MKLVSITLTSETKESVIGEALQSAVAWVDLMLVVVIRNDNPEFVPDTTMAIAHRIAGPKLRVVDVSGNIPFHEMRNVGLVEAEKLGADWSLQLDTDERLILNGLDVRGTLEKMDPALQLVTVTENTGLYDKWRFIRHPTPCRFNHSFHEELVPMLPCVIFPRMRFFELPKTEAQLADRLTSQIEHMQRQLQDEPNNPRWYFYLGSALEQLGKFDEAIPAYLGGMAYLDKPEPKAWTFFRVACCYARMEQHFKVIEYALCGMLHCPEYAELPWLAGMACLFTGRNRDAIAWARIAAVHNWSRKGENEIDRAGFKEPKALFEGPYEIIADAAHRTGNAGLEKWAASEIRRTTKARIKFFEKGVTK